MRLIARLDTKLDYVIKGRKLEGVEKQYKLLEAFEIIKESKFSDFIEPNEFLLHDSVASLYGWKNYYLRNEIIPYSARPLTISGGIRSFIDGINLLRKCERISINTFCFEDLTLLDKLSSKIGEQSISIEIHSINYQNSYKLLSCNGKQPINHITFEDYLSELKNHQFGEINLLSVSNDGMKEGLDLKLFEKVKNYFPNKSIILGGGLDNLDHIDAYKKEGINGIFFSTLFHEKMKKLISSRPD